MSDRDFVSIESPVEVFTVSEKRYAFDVPTGDGTPSTATVTAYTGSTNVTGTIFAGGTTCTVSGQRVTMPLAAAWVISTDYRLDALVVFSNGEKDIYRIEVKCIG